MKFRTCKIIRTLKMGLLSTVFSFGSWATAQGSNPTGFQKPSGYEIQSSKSEAYGIYELKDRFDCLSGGNWIQCNEEFGPFDNRGYIRIEGKVEVASYRQTSEESTNFLLYSNIKREVLQAGGRHVAQYRGGNEEKGFFRHLMVIESTTEKRWIAFDSFGGNRKFPKITVVTQTEIPNILGAIELKRNIEAKGFATIHVNFDVNEAIILSNAAPALQEVVALMNTSKGLKISVEGHTDNIGRPQGNLDLSQHRAKAVMDFLIKQGISPGRLKSVGHGQSVPIADNRAEEGRAQNRRVELVKFQ